MSGRKPACRMGEGGEGSRVAVLVLSPLWRVAGLRPAGRARQAARAAMASCALASDRPADLTIVLAGDGEVQELNRRWRGMNRATNVLSFPSKAACPDGRLLLGDVILAFETIAREAKAARKPLRDHLSHLVIHGVLHLMGYDHEKPAEARRMEGLEVRVLAGLGISDPYAAPRPTSCPGRQ